MLEVHIPQGVEVQVLSWAQIRHETPTAGGFVLFVRRSHVFSVEKTDESGSRKLPSDGLEVICDRKFMFATNAKYSAIIRFMLTIATYNLRNLFDAAGWQQDRPNELDQSGTCHGCSPDGRIIDRGGA